MSAKIRLFQWQADARKTTITGNKVSLQLCEFATLFHQTLKVRQYFVDI